MTQREFGVQGLPGFGQVWKHAGAVGWVSAIDNEARKKAEDLKEDREPECCFMDTTEVGLRS